MYLKGERNVSKCSNNRLKINSNNQRLPVDAGEHWIFNAKPGT